MNNEETKVIEEQKEEVKTDAVVVEPKTEKVETEKVETEKVETEKINDSKQAALQAELDAIKKEREEYKEKYEKLGLEQLKALGEKTEAIEKKMEKTKLETKLIKAGVDLEKNEEAADYYDMLKTKKKMKDEDALKKTLSLFGSTLKTASVGATTHTNITGNVKVAAAESDEEKIDRALGLNKS